MNNIFFVKDRTTLNPRKNYVALFKDRSKAEQECQKIQAKLSKEQHAMISIGTIESIDFDPNKSSVYLIVDKNDKTNHKIVKACFDYSNAFQAFSQYKVKKSHMSQKLVVLQAEQIR